MWKTKAMGQAVWQASDSAWSMDARGGTLGIGLNVDSASQVCFAPVETDDLPVADEQFVRGDQWHVNFPQGSHSYALRLQWKPIVTTATRLVIEACVSIETNLLDGTPKIDLDASCFDIDSLNPDNTIDDREVAGIGSAPISIAKSPRHSVAVLLGPQDAPFTTNHSTDSQLRLRLFGEFLEKGVIRRARPWIVIDRSGDVPTSDELKSLWRQLVESPLPLT